MYACMHACIYHLPPINHSQSPICYLSSIVYQLSITYHLSIIYHLLITIHHLSIIDLSIVSFHLIIPPFYTKDLRWWLTYRITANLCIVLFHWCKLLYLILMMVPGGDYFVSFYRRADCVRMETRIFLLKPMFFNQRHAVQSACHYDKAWYDTIIFYFL